MAGFWDGDSTWDYSDDFGMGDKWKNRDGRWHCSPLERNIIGGKSNGVYLHSSSVPGRNTGTTASLSAEKEQGLFPSLHPFFSPWICRNQIVIVSGSYTVEAAVLVPLLLLIFVMGLRVAMEQYEEIQKEEEYKNSFYGVEEFFRYQRIEEVWEALQNDQS